MTLFSRHRIVRFSLCCGMITSLVACQSGQYLPQTMKTSPESAALAAQSIPPKITVIATTTRHVIFVNPSTGALSPYAANGLTTFLTGISPNNPQAVHLQIRGPLGNAAFNNLIEVAVSNGIERDKISTLVRYPAGGSGVHKRMVPVQLEAVVYRAKPPLCPRPSHMDIGDSANAVASDYGCSNVTDFAAMITDPRDLVRGEQLGPIDSALTNGAINRLRSDTVKPFLNDNSFSPSGGG